MSETIDVEKAVRRRYALASIEAEPCLCVPTSGYDAKYLAAIPQEVIEKDYGCGDPSRWVREGETVLDLGSGGGKICFICAQKVGPRGKVIGVDFNQPMLDLARKHQRAVGNAIGYHNVEFLEGKIQDLRPIIADQTIDIIISNCVLNLVRPDDKPTLFEEMFRVLKPGGRCAISDVVADKDVPQEMQDDPKLWSGCISGALREDKFLAAFERVGFVEVKLLERGETPWQTVNGVEFRAITVEAHKPK